MKSAETIPSPVLAALFVPLWSSGFVTARLVAGHAEPLTFLVWRFVIAGALLALAVIVLRRAWPASGAAVLRAVITGFLIHGVYLGCVFHAVAHGLPAGISALVAGLQPLLTGLLAGPLLHEVVTPRRWAGIALGAVGAGMTLLPKLGALGAGGIPLLPLGIAVIGMIAMTTGTIWQKRNSRAGGGGDLLAQTALQYAGALIPVTLGMLVLEQGSFDWSSPAAVGGLAWSVLAMSIGAILLLMVLIGRGDVARVAALLYLVPGVSALMAFLMFGETMSLIQIAGLGLAAVGVAVASRG